jgi:sulfate-transporting ATPase
VTEFVQFAVRGLGTGSLYVLVAIGIVLVYRGSGVVNFAHGAMGMIGTYVWWEIHVQNGGPWSVAFAAGILSSAFLGVLTHVLVMRPLRAASNLTRVIATLAILAILQAVAALRWPTELEVVSQYLPSGTWKLFGVTLGRDRVLIFALVLGMCALLWLVYRFTRFGLATTAVAENRRGAAALALSPDVIAAANWGIGAALAGLAGILLAPLIGVEIAALTLIVIPALAAAVLGNLASFPLTMLGGFAIGVAQAEVQNYWPSTPGLAGAMPFVLVAVVLWFRGSSIPGKGESGLRLPLIGTGRVRPIVLVVISAIVLYLVWFQFEDQRWIDAVSFQMMIAIVILSVLVVTGYAGQLSLAQYSIAGLGALFAGRLAENGWPFLLALLAGAVMTIPIALAVGVAGVRTRGVNLAIVTLALAAALEGVVFNNVDLTGGVDGTKVGSAKLFGYDISSIVHPERYATFALGMLIALSLLVANVRRGRVGRRLIAVRSNERAAASLGISVVGAKLYAFAFAGAIAAIGGVVVTFRNPSINYTQFGVFKSVQVVQDAVVGGLGYLAGPPLGAGLEPGATGTRIFNVLLENNTYLFLIGGILLLLTVLHAQNGLAYLNEVFAKRLLKFFRFGRAEKPWRVPDLGAPVAHRVAAQTLQTQELSVRFGGIVALENLSITVHPGEVVGLIGPNGAGKTTAVDAITGFNRPRGQVLLDGAPVLGWGRERRSRAGLGRSFQALELFEDMTVLENLQAASDTRDAAAYVTNLVYPGKRKLSAAAAAAIREFGLQDDLHKRPSELPYGRRRLVGLARAVAAEPSILLLDEPAAGLDERESAELGELIRRLASDWGMAVLLIEHDVALVMRTCDRIWALNFGVTIASGTPEEVRSNPAVVEAYLGTAHRGEMPHISPATVEEPATPSAAQL